MNYKKKNIKAVILAGSRDFGRCPLASRLPTALWPVAGRPAIEHLLQHLSLQGLKEVMVCSNGDATLLRKSIDVPNSMNVKFLDEQLPVGTAGCIRDAACAKTDDLLLVFAAGIIAPPALDKLIKAHRSGKCDLTVVFNPSSTQDQSQGEPAGIYICEPAVLQYIPKDGYYDIKESLIPAMLRAGKNVHTVRLDKPVGSFRNHQDYLCAVSDYIEKATKETFGLPVFRQNDSQRLWQACDCEIDSTARIYGPVVIMDRAVISQGSVIFGPTIIGRNAHIGHDSLIADSVLWDGARVGANCQVSTCVLDNNAAIPANTVVREEAIPYQPKTILQRSLGKTAEFISNKADSLLSLPGKCEKLNKLLNLCGQKNIFAWLLAAVLSTAFIWSYWPTIVDLWDIWFRNDEYSSGLLVPFLAVYILWSRRDRIASSRKKPSFWGLLALLCAQAFRYFGLFFMYGSAERLSLVATIAALVLLLFGWQLFARAFTTLVFLGLMLPLPRSVHGAIMLPLQSWATSSAVFCLEIVGYAVVREGNIIHLNGTTVAVAEACNGLRMIMAFFVISGLVVLLARRSWWEKLIVLASSLPIGLLCNSVRLTITAIAFTMLHGEHWERIFHDFGGYAMMPLALAMIVLELWVLQKLITVPTQKQVVLAHNRPC